MDDTRLFTAAQELNGCLRKVLKMKTPGLIQMVNEMMEGGGDKISEDASQVEERLDLKLRR